MCSIATPRFLSTCSASRISSPGPAHRACLYICLSLRLSSPVLESCLGVARAQSRSGSPSRNTSGTVREITVSPDARHSVLAIEMRWLAAIPATVRIASPHMNGTPRDGVNLLKTGVLVSAACQAGSCSKWRRLTSAGPRLHPQRGKAAFKPLLPVRARNQHSRSSKAQISRGVA